MQKSFSFFLLHPRVHVTFLLCHPSPFFPSLCLSFTATDRTVPCVSFRQPSFPLLSTLPTSLLLFDGFLSSRISMCTIRNLYANLCQRKKLYLQLSESRFMWKNMSNTDAYVNICTSFFFNIISHKQLSLWDTYVWTAWYVRHTLIQQPSLPFSIKFFFKKVRFQ